VFRIGTDRFVAAPGSLARTIAGSIGDKLRPRARIVLRRLLAVNKRRPSEIDPAKRALLRPGQNGGRVSNCFASLRCLSTKSSNIGADRPLSRRPEKLPAGNARLIQTAERQQSGRWQTESHLRHQAIHRRKAVDRLSNLTQLDWSLQAIESSQETARQQGSLSAPIVTPLGSIKIQQFLSCEANYQGVLFRCRFTGAQPDPGLTTDQAEPKLKLAA